MYKLFVTALLSLGLLCVIGCGSGSQSSVPVADSIIDSVVISKIETLKMLPDTAYRSASNVKFDIQIPDTAIDGTLESLVDLYKNVPGALTFRGGSRRDANFGGVLDSVPSKIIVDWQFITDEDYAPTKYGAWGGGTGWTGQPLYVEWPDSLVADFKQASKKEIIVGSLSGRVYFIDLESGKASRKAINTENPIKGTVSLDPTLNGNLYVGQGLSAHKTVGALVINLNKHEITHNFGPDPKARRRWEAYDSSPIRAGQFLFRPAENGTLYKFIIEPGSLKLHSALRYTVGGAAPGMESSMAVYRNYGFTADNAGNILCVNLNTLKPVWHYKLPDDIDATPVVVEEPDGGVYVYAGCEVEHAGVTNAVFAKIDALTGKEIWTNRTIANRANVGTKHFDGGYYATCLPGKGNCSDLIFANIVRNTKGQNGEFMAIDCKTGKTVYATPLKHYAWSSPVGFLTKDGKQYIVTGDCAGRIYLINGENGQIISTRQVGNNFESSPVVIGNSLVVGSRGNSIYKISVK